MADGILWEIMTILDLIMCFIGRAGIWEMLDLKRRELDDSLWLGVPQLWLKTSWWLSLVTVSIRSHDMVSAVTGSGEYNEDNLYDSKIDFKCNTKWSIA